MVLLALPCGRDHQDVMSQTSCLKTNFISYLQQKQAAGIINVVVPGSTEVSCNPYQGLAGVGGLEGEREGRVRQANALSQDKGLNGIEIM